MLSAPPSPAQSLDPPGARELADRHAVIERGEVVAHGRGKDTDADGVRGLVAISRPGGFLPAEGLLPGRPGRAAALSWRQHTTTKEMTMPVILWLLGVPLGIVILLMLFHVI